MFINIFLRFTVEVKEKGVAGVRTDVRCGPSTTVNMNGNNCKYH